MLDNIKLLLGLQDSSKDQLILLYIGKLTSEVLDYCKISELNESLQSFIENKVESIMKSKQEQSNVKAVTRGDTRIEYNVGTIDTSNVVNLTVIDKSFLNTFRKVSFI
jgi:hypothetical protein